MTAAIRVTRLGKQYAIGPREKYLTLRETLTDTVLSPRKWLRSFGSGGREGNFIWALRDVSFEVPQGQILGIIGRNGAGKSTLLKILSRITEPTEGRARIYGRVGSLLEVGTGFHPELTGRENIYLNGALLGMSKKEIEVRFDEMVAFAEVDKFIDTPVKRYSSGMYVRLAFAVAAHLQSEILLIDEVLAVGDIAFQRKCLGRMGQIATEGRTVVFVSHNLAAIKALCHRALHLDSGKLKADGNPQPVIERYVRTMTDEASEPASSHRLDGGKVVVRRLRFAESEEAGLTVYWKQPIDLLLDIDVRAPIQNAVFGVGIVSADGVPVMTVHHNDGGESLWSLSPGSYRIRISIENPLRAGLYRLALGAHEGVAKTSIFYLPDFVQFQVLEVSQSEGEAYIGHNTGLVNGSSRWQLESGR